MERSETSEDVRVVSETLRWTFYQPNDQWVKIIYDVIVMEYYGMCVFIDDHQTVT